MVGFAQTNNALDLSDAEMQFQSVEVTLFGSCKNNMDRKPTRTQSS